MRDLIDLQAAPHAPDCDVHRVGTTAHPWCSCGLNATKRQAGLVTQRDGPSVRPNWWKGKQ